MNQLLLGAAIPFVIGLALYLSQRGRASIRFLLALPVAMSLSMLWAVAPDLPRLFGMSQLYHKLSLDPRCDIFYWHYSIDKVETDSNIYLIGFVILLAMLLAVVWRELYLQERKS
jgi:hypothetical protein